MFLCYWLTIVQKCSSIILVWKQRRMTQKNDGKKYPSWFDTAWWWPWDIGATGFGLGIPRVSAAATLFNDYSSTMCLCAFTFLSSLPDRQSPVFENASQNTLWYMYVGMLCVVFAPASGNKRTNKGSGYLSVSLSIKYSPMYIFVLFCFVRTILYTCSSWGRKALWSIWWYSIRFYCTQLPCWFKFRTITHSGQNLLETIRNMTCPTLESARPDLNGEPAIVGIVRWMKSPRRSQLLMLTGGRLCCHS